MYMDLLNIFIITIAFVLLQPNVLFKIPYKGNRFVVILLHAILFAFVVFLIQYFIQKSIFSENLCINNGQTVPAGQDARTSCCSGNWTVSNKGKSNEKRVCKAPAGGPMSA